MEAVFTHIQENIIAYAVMTVFLVPVLIYFRKWTGPVIYHSIEAVIYISIFHVAFHGFVRFVGWFKEMTQFQAIVQEGGPGDYTTPVTIFWDQLLYNPQWLYYVEIGFALAIIGLVAYFRPMSLASRNRYSGKGDTPGSRHTAYQRRQMRRPGAPAARAGRRK